MRHALVVGLGFTFLATPALAAPKTWDHGWDVTTHADVHVAVGDGHVRIHAGPAGHVHAHVEYELKRWGMAFGTGEPTVVFEGAGDHIRISVREPHGIFVMGAVDEQLTVDVTLPQETIVSVHSGDGAIDCEPLTGRFTFETGDGPVRAHGLRGDVDVRTGDGKVTLSELDGRLRARSGDGHVSATGRFDALDLTTSDGRVDASAIPGSRVADGWNVQTDDGAVSLKIPRDLAALLDARTRDGHIHVLLPIGVQGRLREHELVGELNGGGLPLRVRTGDGSITLGLSE